MKVLIIGQGIAGTVLHYYLHASDCKVSIIDKGHEDSASAVAAGIVNPVTGKRLVLSWKFQEIDGEARACYGKLEKELNEKFIVETPILRVLHNPRFVNVWDSKSSYRGYKKYLVNRSITNTYDDLIYGKHPIGETAGSYRIRSGALLPAYRQRLRDLELIREEKFVEEELQLQGETSTYRGEDYDHIIYANGHAASQSQFWNQLPFNLSKGEGFRMRITNLRLPAMIKYKLFLVPMQKDFWVGSSNSWDFSHAKPEEKTKVELLKKFQKSYKIKPEEIRSFAAIRPTVDDRRPLIGTHPKFPQVHLFNGLGTKGISMSPLLSRHFVNYLRKGTPLPQEVNLQRYQ